MACKANNTTPFSFFGISKLKVTSSWYLGKNGTKIITMACEVILTLCLISSSWQITTTKRTTKLSANDVNQRKLLAFAKAFEALVKPFYYLKGSWFIIMCLVRSGNLRLWVKNIKTENPGRGGTRSIIGWGSAARPLIPWPCLRQISLIFLPCLRQNSDFWYPV